MPNGCNGMAVYYRNEGLCGSDWIVEIAFYEHEIRVFECSRQILKSATSEIVRSNYIFSLTQEYIYKVTAYKAGGPGHNYCTIPIR
jgi:hypothetical protein